MASTLRWYQPKAVYEIMTRTMQERFLLRPSEEVRTLVLGVIARALANYPTVSVYAFCVLSNHYHLLASASDGWSLARFIGYINSNIAREAGRLHGWRGRFWSERASVIRIVDDDALIARMEYVVAQGVKEGLVARASDWRGASSTEALVGDMTLRGVWIDRDRETRAARRVRPTNERFDEVLTLNLAPIPPWAHLSAAALRAKHTAMVQRVDRAAAKSRSAPPLGMSAVLAQDPHAAPEVSKHGRRPLCHASTSEGRRGFRAAFHSFVAAFRAAAASVTSSTASMFARFPAHSFPQPPVYVTTAVAGVRDSQRKPGQPSCVLVPVESGAAHATAIRSQPIVETPTIPIRSSDRPRRSPSDRQEADRQEALVIGSDVRLRRR